MRRLGWLAVSLPVVVSSGGAQELTGDAEAGARLAREVCAACHVVSDDQMVDPGIGPWFIDVAQHPATTALSLRAFLQTPHADMPDLILTREETDDIIAYILTLKDD
jgi:mono/diheme cytochrome c family protein